MAAIEAESGSEECFGWWQRKEGVREADQTRDGVNGLGTESAEFQYAGLELGLARIAETLREQGPFDGVVGFSQGGCAAGMVASLLEGGPRRAAFEEQARKGGIEFPQSFVAEGDAMIHLPLRFAAIYSGFGVPMNPLYRAFYDPPIQTPMIHFLGTLDTVVEEARSMRLADSCLNKKVVHHPGGHFLPASQRDVVGALVSFINEAMGWTDNKSAEEEKAEDMQMPF